MAENELSSLVSTTGCIMRHVPQMDCACTVMTAIRATSENKNFFIMNLLFLITRQR